MRLIHLMLAMPILCAGCASDPNKIVGSYVSPNKYAAYTCEQINGDMAILAPRLDASFRQQRERRNVDTAGIILVGLSPTMFRGSAGLESDISVMKGERDALIAAATAKGCPIGYQPAAALPTAAGSATKPKV